MNPKNRLIALASAACLLAATAATGSVSPAYAADLWHGRNHTTGVVLVGGETLSSSGTLEIQFQWNGIATTVTCTFEPGDIPVTVPTPAPTAPATGGTVSYTVMPPGVVSSSTPGDPMYNRCVDTQTGEADDVTATGAWTASIDIPGAAISPYTGPTTASITVPANGIRWTTPVISGCVITAPSVATTFGGNYDGGPGTFDLTPYQPFRSRGAGCTASRARLNSTSFTLDPAIDFVLAP